MYRRRATLGVVAAIVLLPACGGTVRHDTQSSRLSSIAAWIAFTTPDGAAATAPLGRTAKVLTSPPPGLRDVPLAWSPDGRWLAFLRIARDEAHGTAHVVSTRGRGERSLSDVGDVTDVAWSATSEEVAFVAESLTQLREQPALFSVRVVELSSGRARTVTAAVPGRPCSGPSLEWAPGTSFLVILESGAISVCGREQVLFGVDTRTGRARSVEVGVGQIVSTSWSPTGDRIAFTGADSLVVTDAIGERTIANVLIPTTSFGLESVRWSRDGHSVFLFGWAGAAVLDLSTLKIQAVFGEPLSHPETTKNLVRDLQTTPDGGPLLVATQSAIRALDAKTRQPVATYPLPRHSSNPLLYVP